jgi:glycosyltransferase involved in cell wall biosynthesis
MSSVDVIVPCYRYGHFLRECVESVLAQANVEVRVLILDDESPDNTSEVGAALAAEDKRVSYIRHVENKGHISTYNEGIDWVAGDYMLLLSADDYLLPGALERATHLLDSHPEVGFVFGRAIELSADGGTEPTERILAAGVSEKIMTGAEFIMLSGSRNVVPTPTAVVRTRLQKELGGYRVELPHAGDMEMWLRLAANGCVGVISEPLAVYRLHAANMSHTYNQRGRLPDLLQRKAAFDYFMENQGQKLVEGERIRRTVMRQFAINAVSLASGAFNEGDIALVDELVEYAIWLSPDIRMSVPWAKLKAKRAIGVKGWRKLNAFFKKSGEGELESRPTAERRHGRL